MCQFYLNNNDNSELKPPNILQNYKLFSNPATSALPIVMAHVQVSLSERMSIQRRHIYLFSLLKFVI